MTTDAVDPVRYYSLEKYLFDEIGPKFHRQGWLDAFDFFSIIIWKANRAKSNIAKRLLANDPKGRSDLNRIARDLTAGLYAAAEDRQRLELLVVKWGLRLPMASAVLTVLWPKRFTVYDVRVCEQLGGFQHLDARTNFDNIWDGYQEFIEAVHDAVPKDLSLRDKDRFLWSESAIKGLRADIKRKFKKSN